MKEYSVKEMIGNEIVAFFVMSPDGHKVKEFSEADYDYTIDASSAASAYALEQNFFHFRAEAKKQKEIAEAHKKANIRLVAEKNEEIRILRELDKFQVEDITRLETELNRTKIELSLAKEFIKRQNMDRMFGIWKSTQK